MNFSSKYYVKITVTLPIFYKIYVYILTTRTVNLMFFLILYIVDGYKFRRNSFYFILPGIHTHIPTYFFQIFLLKMFFHYSRNVLIFGQFAGDCAGFFLVNFNFHIYNPHSSTPSTQRGRIMKHHVHKYWYRDSL